MDVSLENVVIPKIMSNHLNDGRVIEHEGVKLMSVFISVVSHGHGELIKNLGCLKKLAEVYTVVVKLNVAENELIPYLEDNGIQYINESYGLGFGHNNNLVYNYCQNYLNMKPDDYFFVFNPDVVAEQERICELTGLMQNDDIDLAAVNLFKDSEHSIPDNSIRTFPTFIQFVKSFLGLGNSAIIDKSLLSRPTKVDWASGSFLAFSVSHYAKLNGFDEGYFMYCEDIDICYRSSLLGKQITYYPQIKMLHLAKHANRSIFSKHFNWHVKSVVRFLLSKRGLTKVQSSIV